MSDASLPRRLTAESLGTFALVFIGPGAAVVNRWSGGAVTHVGVALSFFLVIAGGVYAFGAVSGAHFNPAVTFGLTANGRFPRRDALPYIAAQLAGATLAAEVLRWLFPDAIVAAATVPRLGATPTLVIESLLTLFLMLVILRVIDDPVGSAASGAVLIGAAVGFDALMGGPVTGASMNPARSFGPALVAGLWEVHWAYWLGPLLGATVGARLHTYLHQPANHDRS